jgi:phage-related minor tail protein
MADFDDSLRGAAQSLSDFASGPVANAASSIERAVDRSFGAVSDTIARAAASGRGSISQLTSAVLADFERIAASQFIVRPVSNLVSSVIGSLLPIAGARAAGGPVMGGESYLVGERGPELFTPAGNGAITPNAAMGASRPQVVVNIHAQDAQSFMRSKSQVAAMLARAVNQGQRNL